MDRWNYAFTVLPDAVLLFDRSGRIERANPAAEAALRLPSVKVLLGHTCAEALHGRLVPAAACPVCRVEGRREPAEWTGQAPGLPGRWRVTAVPGMAHRGGDGAVLVARTCEDRPPEAEAARRAVESGLYGAMTTVDAPTQVIDVATYEVLWANEAKLRQFGSNLVGRRCYEVFRDHEGPCADCPNAQLVRAGRPGKAKVWLQTDAKTGERKVFVNKAFVWPDGRMVKLEMTVDLPLVEEPPREGKGR